MLHSRYPAIENLRTVGLSIPTNSHMIIRDAVLDQFDSKTDHRLLYRRLGVNAIRVKSDDGVYQLDLFTDYAALEKERRIQGAMMEIRRRFGRYAVLKGMNLLDGAMTRERNEQIAGTKLMPYASGLLDESNGSGR